MPALSVLVRAARDAQKDGAPRGRTVDCLIYDEARKCTLHAMPNALTPLPRALTFPQSFCFCLHYPVPFPFPHPLRAVSRTPCSSFQPPSAFLSPSSQRALCMTGLSSPLLLTLHLRRRVPPLWLSPPGFLYFAAEVLEHVGHLLAWHPRLAGQRRHQRGRLRHRHHRHGSVRPGPLGFFACLLLCGYHMDARSGHVLVCVVLPRDDWFYSPSIPLFLRLRAFEQKGEWAFFGITLGCVVANLVFTGIMFAYVHRHSRIFPGRKLAQFIGLGSANGRGGRGVRCLATCSEGLHAV